MATGTIRRALAVTGIYLALGATFVAASAVIDALVSNCWWPGVPAFMCDEPPTFDPAELESEVG